MKGVVTFEGNPVKDATVTFQHEGEGGLTVGTTDEAGSFTLSAPGAKDQQGVRIGRHQVMIAAVEILPSPHGSDSQFGSLAMDTAPGPRIKNLLPLKYSTFETSGLTFDVEPASGNFAEFELTK